MFGAFIALLVVTIPLTVQAGFISSLFSGFTNQTSAAATTDTAPTSVIDTQLLSATTNPAPVGGQGGAEVYVEEGTLVPIGPVGEDDIANSEYRSGEIRVYTVTEGDALSHIAHMYGVSINTIRWANDLDGPIQPGDELLILPISGIRHTVEKGETLGGIVKKYKGDLEEVLAYNQLATADSISVGDVVVVPGGALQSAPSAAYAPAPSKVSGSGGGGLSHPLPGSVKTQGLHGYNGVDFGAPAGTPIKAAASGEVIVAKSGGWNGGYGTYLVIRHSNGMQTLYAHNTSNLVGVGAWVTKGQSIATVGSTGRSTGDHLHFEVRGGYNPF